MKNNICVNAKCRKDVKPTIQSRLNLVGHDCVSSAVIIARRITDTGKLLISGQRDLNSVACVSQNGRCLGRVKVSDTIGGQQRIQAQVSIVG